MPGLDDAAHACATVTQPVGDARVAGLDDRSCCYFVVPLPRRSAWAKVCVVCALIRGWPAGVFGLGLRLAFWYV